MTTRRQTNEQRIAIIEAFEKERIQRPGFGWLTVSKEELLIILGLPVDVNIMGVRWSAQEQMLKVDVKGKSIPWQGGKIVNLNPIQTEKQLRDNS